MSEANKTILELSTMRDKILVIHYAGEGWITDNGKSGRIASITIKNLRNKQLKTFSLYHEIQKNNVDISNEKNLDIIEKSLLQKYFNYIKELKGYKWVHWNMRFPAFGFGILEDRYNLLGGRPVYIPDDNKIDLAQILGEIYGSNFETEEKNGKMINMLHRNNIFDSDIVRGPTEIEYFKAKDFLKIYLSNMKKVDGISELFNLTLSGQIRTNKNINQPLLSTKMNTKIRVFIGSSVEGLKVAQSIQAELARDYEVEIWDQGTVFGLGSATLEALEKAVERYQFGIFVFTPDDELLKRGESKPVARDNVLFELGLFIGKLTRFRAFIVHPQGNIISLPTDLAGITTATYNSHSGNIRASLGPACVSIRSAIEQTK